MILILNILYNNIFPVYIELPDLGNKMIYYETMLLWKHIFGVEEYLN